MKKAPNEIRSGVPLYKHPRLENAAKLHNMKTFRVEMLSARETKKLDKICSQSIGLHCFLKALGFGHEWVL